MRARATHWKVIATLTAVGVVVTAVALAWTARAPMAAPVVQARGPGPPGEAEEQSEELLLRLQAMAAAESEGRLGRIGPVVRDPAPGWAGARIVHPHKNDWEPATAADPNEPWVYIAVTRFGRPVCGDCPWSAIMLERSHDGGRTWSKARPVCRCAGTRFQADPLLEVAADTGRVYAAWLDGWTTVVAHSDDHAKTWSRPISTKGPTAWTDKPALVTSDDGSFVAVSWNGPHGGDPFVSVSQDGGESWTRQRVLESDRYFFAYDGTIAADGTIAFAESSITYSGPGGAAAGVVKHHVLRSTDGGETWENVIVDSVRIGEPCVSEGCGSDYYIGHSTVASDDSGTMLMVYDGATKTGRPQRIFAKVSTDSGQTWSARRTLSVPGSESSFPMSIGTGTGGFRVWFAQTNDGDHDRWNIWFRQTADGGASWSPAVRLSDVTSGYPYVRSEGFLEPYGDYGEIALTNVGKTFAAWGEGTSYAGPGGVWFNRQR